MYKIRKVEFKGHPVLGDLSLDFCGLDGKAVGTVILAGENGTGKSTILNELYLAITDKSKIDVEIELENDDEVIRVQRRSISSGNIETHVTDENGKKCDFRKLDLTAIYSDVINDFSYNPFFVTHDSKREMDIDTKSMRSDSKTAGHVVKMFIDACYADYSSIGRASKGNPELSLTQLAIDERMSRFKNAFNEMFDDLKCGDVEEKDGQQDFYFKKNGTDVPVSSLSSGEKQIVFRGAYLLGNVNSMRGAFVFIDEPEMSLHPKWQQKIMNYYKDIFTDSDGNQTSQIFVATQSPFIIHNDYRWDDKVIVLKRTSEGDNAGMIIVTDNPRYYRCNSEESVRDAFGLENFLIERNAVYVEGPTDEKYFNKALEVYGYGNPGFEFKAISHEGPNGSEGGGERWLKSAAGLLMQGEHSFVSVVLFDSDVIKIPDGKDNVHIMRMPKSDNKHGIERGIENALVFDDEIDLTPYCYCEKYGNVGEGKISGLKRGMKMALCDKICSLEPETLKKIFSNLKTEIDRLVAVFNEV